MLGAFAVGKTSLVSQFVSSLFSEDYLTTVGVKIDKKTINVAGTDVMLMLWDIAGEDDLQSVRMSYLRGAAGILLVSDGTRPGTLETARSLLERAQGTIGAVPFVAVVNKNDLDDEWEVDPAVLDGLEDEGWTVVSTSAKTGEGVEEAFRRLAWRILPRDPA
jgi:small GTP-binding protein